MDELSSMYMTMTAMEISLLLLLVIDFSNSCFLQLQSNCLIFTFRMSVYDNDRIYVTF